MVDVGKISAFWRARLPKGDIASTQHMRIQSLLTGCLGNRFYPNGCDFGCGVGRFTKQLSNNCGHVWSFDLLQEAVDCSEKLSQNVTGIRVGIPLKLPFRVPTVDFLFACLIFQHIVKDDVLVHTLKELSKSLNSGAKVVIIDNAKDVAPHVKPRKPDWYAAQLRLTNWKNELISINDRPLDHWLIEGIKV